MPRVDRFVLLFLLGIVLAGGHLGLLRLVAWTSMLIDRCSSEPLSLAISTTFDGEHPCQLCRAIEREQDGAPGQLRHPTVVAKLAKVIALIGDPWRQPDTTTDRSFPFPATMPRLSGIALSPPVPPPTRS